MKNKIIIFLDKKIPFWKQFIKFGIVGASNTFINLFVYYFLVYVFKLETTFQINIAVTLSYVVSIINAVFWNFKWVFKNEASKLSKQEKKSSVIKLFVIYILTFLLSLALTYLWNDILNINKYIFPILTLLITIPLNFMLNKFWSFKN